MPAATGLGLHAKYDLHVLQAIAFEARTCHLGADATIAGRRVGKIDPSVLRVTRMQCHVHQTALPVLYDARQSVDRSRVDLEIR